MCYTTSQAERGREKSSRMVPDFSIKMNRISWNSFLVSKEKFDNGLVSQGFVFHSKIYLSGLLISLHHRLLSLLTSRGRKKSHEYWCWEAVLQKTSFHSKNVVAIKCESKHHIVYESLWVSSCLSNAPSRKERQLSKRRDTRRKTRHLQENSQEKRETIKDNTHLQEYLP